MMRTMVAACRDRFRSSGRDEGVAMMVVIMMMLVMTSLSLLVLGIVASQVAPAQFARKNTTTIFAAEAGVEAAMARVRSAAGAPDFTGTTYGDPSKLPCTIDGVVDAASGSTTYSATVRYFLDDPAGKPESWLAANELTCTAGSGVSSAALPAYALITSNGTAANGGKVTGTEGDRGISMTYQFETTTKNVAGGRLYSWLASSTAQFCLRATSAAAGATVTYRPVAECGSSANEKLELWVYDTAYTIKLASSLSEATPLCMTNESGTIRLRACTSPTYNQMFAWHKDGNATFVAQNSSIEDAGTCLFSGRTSGTPVAGDTLKVGSCASQAAWGSFSPDPAVGPGGASANTNQIVNYLEFGRCFDVTDTDVNKAFMISYPCKQDPPSGANLFWNHRWYYQEPLVGTVAAPQNIYVYQNNDKAKKYCLKAPAAQTNPNLSGVGVGWYPTLTSACSTSDPAQLWTRSTGTGSKSTSYTFKDSSGRCIGVGGPKYLSNWSALIVAPCDGTTAQKWNAPADKVEAEVGDYLEETG